MNTEINEIKFKIKSSLKTLGLELDASPDEIRAAFRELARIYHPDVAAPKDAWRFQQITGAYSLLKNLNFLENLDIDNLTAEDLENLKDLKDFKDFKSDNANANEAEAKEDKNDRDDEAEDVAEQARAKNFAAKIDAVLTRYENEIENFIANQNQEAEQAQTQELKDNIIFRLNSQSSAVRNIAIKRIGNLINRDDVRQTLINLILNHGIDSESSRLIEALPMDNDTRERIASSVCEKSAAFPSSLIIKLLDLRNLNNLNFNFNLI